MTEAGIDVETTRVEEQVRRKTTIERFVKRIMIGQRGLNKKKARRFKVR
jgi:hypothetical protein